MDVGNILVWAVWFGAAFACLGSGVAVVWFSNPFYSALALIGNLAALAVLYLLLSAEFVAAAQVLVYAGAVMVMFLFVIAYLGGRADAPWAGGPTWQQVAAVGGSLLARERDQRQVRAVEHDLEREQDDQGAAADQHAECSDREQERRDDEVPGEVGAVYRSILASSLREWAPRMTPPTAAIRSTIEVISNASRCCVRKSSPIWCGPPKNVSTGGSFESRPPAFSPTATTTSTRIAPAALIAATCCHDGPPAHGASARPPRYAITNRNITITAPA